MNSNFFSSNSYFIDEKVNFFKFENAYSIYDENGLSIGSVRQKLSLKQKLMRMVLNKAMLPFLLEIKNQNDETEASISRGWTFFMSKIKISDAHGNQIGSIRQKFKLFQPTFKVFDANEHQIAEISGDWKAWNFIIKDENSNQIGTISKKWAGAMKEVFTSADKYNVYLDSGYSDKNRRIAVLAGAITIDMVLKESK